ncbi:MAG: class I SAM-dependent methyltransferase [Candidatus Nanopelagicales bacterium]
MFGTARAGVDPAATIARSVRLAAAFRVEQSDPGRFYGLLAADSARQVSAYVDLTGASLLDVGGGPGYFADAFTAAGARCIAVDVDAGETRLHGRAPGPCTVLGSGMALPFGTGALDIAYSSNVLEHVDRPWRMADEMVRVVRPGGTVFLSYTLWYGPWGGHETAPWHLLGGRRAADRYERRFGRRPKNDYGVTLFPVTAAEGLRWARRHSGVELVAAVPRYLPRWCTFVLGVPAVREVLAWNLLLVLRVRT